MVIKFFIYFIVWANDYCGIFVMRHGVGSYIGLNEIKSSSQMANFYYY